MASLRWKPRTAEQREADTKANEPKHARERRVNAILTARYLKAKSAFDKYFKYDPDAAFNPEDGSWNDELDPWLRITDTLPEFLKGFTENFQASGGDLMVEDLESLASAIFRIAKEQLEGAGRDSTILDQNFQAALLDDIAELKTKYHLPQAAGSAEEEGGED